MENHHDYYNQKNRKQIPVLIAVACCCIGILVACMQFGVFNLKKSVENSASNEKVLSEEPSETSSEEQTSDFSPGNISWGKDENGAYLNVPYLNQDDLLPSGCELVSSLMMMEYYHYSYTVDDIIDNLDVGNLSEINDSNYDYAGPSPEECFVGNPLNGDGFGCFPPVIQKMMNRLLKGGQQAVDTSGENLDDLAKQYLGQGKPVLIWTTISWGTAYPSDTWLLTEPGVYSIPEEDVSSSLITDRTYTWPANEHCVVFVGYDEDNFYFNDPYADSGMVAYSKDQANQCYETMGYRSLAVE